MAGKSSYELHHHFPRVAEESGFTFNIHRSRAHIDWNKFSKFIRRFSFVCKHPMRIMGFTIINIIFRIN